MKLSIIIPTLNEESCIKSILAPLQNIRKKGHEIILVDGGSRDNTREKTIGLVDKFLTSMPGRAKQMNFGAKNATGEILLFLHADTLIPENIDNILSININNDLSWGRFKLKLTGKRFIYRVIETLINLRSKLSGISTGDQGIFITSNLFIMINGFPDIPLMEDIAICRRLKIHAKPIFINHNVISSSRRWEEKGVLKTILIMWKLRFQFWIGIDPSRLAKMYE